MRMLKSNSGASLFEVLLVMILAIAILLLGLRMYQNYNRDKTFAQLQGLVDQLFLGMTGYYYANCRGDTAGTLPATPPASLASVPVLVSVLSGSYVVNWNPFNPLIYGNGQSTNPASFVLQYNPIVSGQAINANACIVLTPGTACTPYTQTIPTTQALSLRWEEQVAVKLPSSTNADVYKNRLGASCLSDLTASGTTVIPCQQVTGSTAKNYLVWQRTPSYSTNSYNSPLFLSRPIVTQFTMQYYQDQMNQLQNGNSGVSYYLCGG